MDAFSAFEKVVDVPDLKQPPTITRKIDNQVLVDENMKKKWDEAKDGKEKTAVLIAVNEMVLRGLKQGIDSATGDLVQPVEHCARLSLAGSCSAQMRGEIKSLEAMVKRGFTCYEEDYRERLDQKKRKLELLNEVEDALKGGSE